MPLEIVRNDIVNMQADIIVNTANPKAIIGSGVDSAIQKKAGQN
jgi:O-acetyl-ADP-ribose deacetylase (regulator of RNase III)